MADDLSATITKLLHDERHMIIDAKFDEVAALEGTKTALFDDLAKVGTMRKTLKEIQTLLDQNQALLAAAINGVTAARDRLAALENVREGLNVYDKSGHLATVNIRQPEMEKKA